MAKKKKLKTRDKNIQLLIKREISLKTKTIKSKKIYSRKLKHKLKHVAKLSLDGLATCFPVVKN